MNETIVLASRFQFPWESEALRDVVDINDAHPIRRSQIHKRHWCDPINKIEYGICTRHKGFGIIEKHHDRLKRHCHPGSRERKRIPTCPDCHVAFHVLADMMEYLIKERYPLSNHKDSMAVSALMREHVWEFDELNRRYFYLGEDLKRSDLDSIVDQGEVILKKQERLMKKLRR